jgi:hypothetical protein
MSLSTKSIVFALLLLSGVAVGCGTATAEGGATTVEGGEPTGDPEPAEPQTVEPKEPPKDGPPNPMHLKSSKEAVVAVTAENSTCESDADCVKNACCHAKECVNKQFAPQCEGVMCTLDCRGGTMDCGWGKCLCQEGKCVAEIEAPPRPPVKGDPPRPPVKPE